MKKIFIALTSLFAVVSTTSAQEAFRHLSFGVEAGTAGVGVELALPIVTDHVVVKAGYHFFFMDYSYNVVIKTPQVEQLISDANDFLSNAGVPERINGSLNKIEYVATPMANFEALKLMFEFYPSAKRAFHFTAGLFYGLSDDLLDANIQTSEESWANYKSIRTQVNDISSKYSDYDGFDKLNLSAAQDVELNIGKRTFEAKEVDAKGTIDLGLQVSKVRPYLGLGFGKSIPDTHFSFQTDLGVWYHGKPTLVSENEVTYNPEAQELMSDISLIEKLSIYPRISFRLIYKLY